MTTNEVHENGSEAEMLNINTDENMSGDQHLNDPVADESELEKLRGQIQELNDRYLRQVAEFDNFRRRTAREREEVRATAGKDIILELVEVLDDAERALTTMESASDIQPVREGVSLVFNKLRQKLSAKGLKPMESLDTEFNVDQHEAVTEVEAGPDKKGKVVAEVQKGYYLNEKIIRFAKVVVGK